MHYLFCYDAPIAGTEASILRWPRTVFSWPETLPNFRDGDSVESPTQPTIEIDSYRLNKRIQDISEIGSTLNGGSNRQALTDDDAKARELFINWCESSACTVRVDAMGNIFARRGGSNPEADPVLIGSHLDTQPTGGRFDGVYGVLAGLEVIETLNDSRVQGSPYRSSSGLMKRDVALTLLQWGHPFGRVCCLKTKPTLNKMWKVKASCRS